MVSPLVWVPVSATLLGVLVFVALSLRETNRGEQPAESRGAMLAAVAAQPERYKGRSVRIVGTVLRTGRGRFVLTAGRRQVLVVPGLRERAVRVENGDRVRVTGSVRVVNQPTADPRAAPIPDYDGRAAVVPERVEKLHPPSSG